VVDVRDDAKIPDVLGIHGYLCDWAAPPRAMRIPLAPRAPLEPLSVPHNTAGSQRSRSSPGRPYAA
jgi:hypothetical protein